MAKEKPQPSWLKTIIGGGVEPLYPEPIPVGPASRNLQDYANDISIAQRRIVQKMAELKSAHEEKTAACKAFAEHSAKLNLPLEITEQPWPQAPYKFEDGE